MRLAVMVASVVSVSALLVLAACGDQSNDIPSSAADGDAGTPKKKPGSSGASSGAPQDDGGTSSSSSSSSSSSGGTQPVGTQLVNQAVVLWGVTDDGMAVYSPLPATQGAPTSLEAIPLAGGGKTTLAATLADTDSVSVSGGAVAWWTSISGGLGTINVWTKGNGAKAGVSTVSIPGVFGASSDGSRVAFSVGGTIDNTDPANPTPTATNLAVTDSANPTGTAIKLGATTLSVNLASQTCFPDIGFAGNVFLAGFCPAGSDTGQHLYAVGAADTAATRLDGTGATTSLKPMADGTFWSADATGSKVFAIVGSAATGRIFNGSGGTLASIGTGIVEGLMQSDGSAVVYRNATTLGRATAVAPPVSTTLLAGGTTPKGIQALSKDGNKLLFNTMDPPANGAPLVDIRAIDTTTAAQTPVDIVATGTGYPLGFTGDSAHVLYYTDVSNSGVTLKTKTPAGTGETTLATNIVAARPARAGSGVLIRTNKQQDAATGLTTYDLQSVDAAGGGGTPKTIASGVPAGLYEVSGSKLVYVSFDTTYAGLYVTTLP